MNIEGLFPDRPKTGWHVKIDKMQVVNGHIKISDQVTGRDVVLKSVAGYIYPDLDKKEVSTDLSGSGDYKDPYLSHKNLKAKGNLVFVIKEKKLNRIKFRDINISSRKGSYISADGFVGRDGYVDLKGKAFVLLNDIAGSIPGKKELKGKVTFNGGIKGNLPLPVIDGNIDAEGVAYDGVKYGKVKGRLLWEEKLFTLANIKGNILGGEIDGNIRIDHKNGIPSYTVKLKGKTLEPYKVMSRYVPGISSSLDKKGVFDMEIDANGRGLDRNEIASKGWLTYHDENQKLSLSGELNKGLNLSIGMTGELKDIAGYLHIPHFPLHGVASLSGEISGSIEKPVVSGVVAMPEGIVNGVTFDTVTADISLSEGNLTLKPVTFRRSDAIYSITGNIRFRSPGFKDPYFDVQGDITQGNPKDIVSIFYKDLPLHMKASGKMSFRGGIKDFSGSADMHVFGGSAYGQTFENGYVAATLTTDRVIIERVSVERKDETAEGKGWIGFAGESKGEFYAELNSEQFILQNVDILKKRLPSVSGTGTLKVKGSGKINDPVVEADIQVPHLMINGTDTGLTQLTVSKEGDVLKLNGNIMDIHYDGTMAWNKDAWIEVTAHMNNSRLNTFLLLLKPSLARDITITATGEIVLKGSLSDFNTIKADAVLSQVTTVYGEYSLENDGEIHLSYEANRLSLDIVRFKGEGTSLGMIGNLVPNGEVNVFINGEADLRLLTLFTPEIKYSKGKAFLAFLMSGELRNPIIQGGLAIRDGTIRSATLKQTLEGAELSLFFNGREIVLESMSGKLGGGTVNVTGKVTTEDFVVKEFAFVLEIADAIFRYPEGLTSKIDGTLIFQGTPELRGLRGEINIEKTAYEKR